MERSEVYATLPEAQSYLKELQDNRHALNNCERHHFSATEVRPGQKLICDRCGGWMNLADVTNYIRGYQAAGKAASDIWPTSPVGN